MRVWFLPTQLLAQPENNVSVLEFRRHLRVPSRTAWLPKHKLMRIMT